MADRRELSSTVALHRQAAGLTATDLAARVGISRQALAAIESGRSTPSTAISLRIARQLGCRVEDLFQLEPEGLDGLRLPELAGSRVVLGQVSDRWVAHPMDRVQGAPADGIVDSSGAIALLREARDLADTALIAGCAPALGVLAGRSGDRARWLHAGSTTALCWLAEGRVHLAGMHLADRGEPEAHDALVRSLSASEAVVLIPVLAWREGLIAAPGNPLGLCGAADLGREGLRVAQRSAGSGAARVLERARASEGVRTPLIGPSVRTHADAALAVCLGAADTAVVIEPVAEALGLPFFPLSEERFELAVRAEHLAHPGVARLLDTLNTADFAREILGMGALELDGIGGPRRVEAA